MGHQKRSRNSRVPRGSTNTASFTVADLKKELLTREEWLRLAAQGSQLGLWYWNEVTKTLFWDRRTREIFGVNLDGEVTVQTFYDALHPDDRLRVQEVWRYELQSGLPYELEYRARWPDGSVRWIAARGSGYYDEHRAPLYMIGVVFDITERKELERERLELSGRLIYAQERERAHLAREIHDDFCQRFALLTLKLQTLAHGTAGPEAGSTLRELADTAAALGDDIRHFSHRLHSSKLEVLGLVPSSASLCAAFAKEHGVRIDFDDADIPDELPSAVSLCLFRILQESLRNIVKHSHASRAEVRLSADAHVISMCVFDDGLGFDTNAMSESDGIGIVSMKERARLCDGRCLVQSRPAVAGTRIDVIIPLAVKLLAS